jgi:hypothetical protein
MRRKEEIFAADTDTYSDGSPASTLAKANE